MSVLTLLSRLEPEIEDPEEEPFLLFSQSIPSQNLGFVDSKAKSIGITVGGRDFIIRQSPTILSSTRDGGTTGAVVWKISPLVATWISSSDNPLFDHRVLCPTSSVLELGCGISGIIGMALISRVRQYFLTDQAYVLKFLNENLLENVPSIAVNGNRGRKSLHSPKKGLNSEKLSSNIMVRPLDWETDDISSVVAGLEDGMRSFDAVIACDCIYNDALIQPLVQTCVDACELRRVQAESSEPKPTVCIIAQQLRSPEVFEKWLKAFHQVFRVWRFPDEYLTNELASNSGFVIHAGILR